VQRLTRVRMAERLKAPMIKSPRAHRRADLAWLGARCARRHRPAPPAHRFTRSRGRAFAKDTNPPSKGDDRQWKENYQTKTAPATTAGEWRCSSTQVGLASHQMGTAVVQWTAIRWWVSTNEIARAAELVPPRCQWGRCLGTRSGMWRTKRRESGYTSTAGWWPTRCTECALELISAVGDGAVG
jgi:hypothetical protein